MAIRRKASVPSAGRSDAQMARATYLNDQGEVIWTGLVPKDLQADRAKGMKWVAEQDRIKADREAAEAEELAAAEAAKAAAPPAPDPLEVATAAGQQAQGLAGQVAELAATIDAACIALRL